MPGYIVSAKFTQKQMDNLKDLPEGIKRTKELAKEMGIRTVGIWVTMGADDGVGIFDAPDDQTMATFVLQVAQAGNLSTRTMRAFGEDEIGEIIGLLA